MNRWQYLLALRVALCGMALSQLGFAGMALAQDEPTPDEPQTIPVDDSPPEDSPAARDATVLDTIEVTSSKRIKSQRDLPGSVSALRGEELEKMRADGLADYLKRVPGVSFTEGELDEGVPVIRGITTTTSTGGNTQLTTGIYADDMPFTDVGIPLSVPDLYPFDLERVEVLKGPQGTLFGSGALAGAIRYILNKPVHAVWQGKLMGSVYSTEQSESLGSVIGGAINVPLFGDAIAVRATGVVRDAPGLYDERDRGVTDLDEVEQQTARLLASWQGTDRLKIHGMYFQQDGEQADAGYADNPQEASRGQTLYADTHESSFGGANLTGTYAFDWATLYSSTNRVTKHAVSLFHQERFLGTGVPSDPLCTQNCDDVGVEDQSAVQALPGYFEGDILGYTQELRLSSPEGGDDADWDWLVGAFYQSYEQNHVQLSGYGTSASPEPNALIAYFDITSSDKAVFGEASRRFGPHWEATVGARVFEQSLKGDSTITGVVGTALFGTEEHRSHDTVERGVTPKVSLRYLHDRNIQAYVLAARGYQFGGVQLVPPQASFEVAAEAGGGFGFQDYKSSKLWNYELGVRTEWLDRRLRFDAAMFYMDWKDLQLTQFAEANQTGVSEDNAQARTTVVGNVGGAHSKGLEAALEVIPFGGATFTSAAAWISAVTDEPYPSPNGTVPPGARTPGTPRFQWSNVLSLTRAVPYFTSFEGALGIAHTHTGSSFGTLEGDSPRGGFDTLDASLGVRSLDNTWLPELGFNVKNITDVRGLVNSDNTFAGAESYVFTRPRTLMLTLSWRI
jgi:iron complex outermembrane recepter protein